MELKISWIETKTLVQAYRNDVRVLLSFRNNFRVKRFLRSYLGESSGSIEGPVHPITYIVIKGLFCLFLVLNIVTLTV